MVSSIYFPRVPYPHDMWIAFNLLAVGCAICYGGSYEHGQSPVISDSRGKHRSLDARTLPECRHTVFIATWRDGGSPQIPADTRCGTEDKPCSTLTSAVEQAHRSDRDGSICFQMIPGNLGCQIAVLKIPVTFNFTSPVVLIKPAGVCQKAVIKVRSMSTNGTSNPLPQALFRILSPTYLSNLTIIAEADHDFDVIDVSTDFVSIEHCFFAVQQNISTIVWEYLEQSLARYPGTFHVSNCEFYQLPSEHAVDTDYDSETSFISVTFGRGFPLGEHINVQNSTFDIPGNAFAIVCAGDPPMICSGDDMTILITIRNNAFSSGEEHSFAIRVASDDSNICMNSTGHLIHLSVVHNHFSGTIACDVKIVPSKVFNFSLLENAIEVAAKPISFEQSTYIVHVHIEGVSTHQSIIKISSCTFVVSEEPDAKRDNSETDDQILLMITHNQPNELLPSPQATVEQCLFEGGVIVNKNVDLVLVDTVFVPRLPCGKRQPFVFTEGAVYQVKGEFHIVQQDLGRLLRRQEANENIQHPLSIQSLRDNLNTAIEVRERPCDKYQFDPFPTHALPKLYQRDHEASVEAYIEAYIEDISGVYFHFLALGNIEHHVFSKVDMNMSARLEVLPRFRKNGLCEKLLLGKRASYLRHYLFGNSLPNGLEALCFLQQGTIWHFGQSRSRRSMLDQSSHLCSRYAPVRASSGLYSAQLGQVRDGRHRTGAQNEMSQQGMCDILGQTFLVSNRLGALRPLVRTPHSWMLLRSTSTGCAKVVRGLAFVSKTSCNATIEDIMNLHLRMNVSMADDSMLYLVDLIMEQPQKITNVLIGSRFVMTPWSHVAGASWDVIARKGDDLPKWTTEALYILGHMHVVVAPGEYIQLNVDVLDSGLGHMTAEIKLQVEAADVRLLKTGGIHVHCKQVKELLFKSDTPLSGFALAGSPGKEGHLLLTLVEETVSILGSDRPFTLRIPFYIRPCHMGFALPSEMSALNWVQRVCICQHHPAGVSRCSSGKYVHIKAGYWAGDATPPPNSGEDVASYDLFTLDVDETVAHALKKVHVPSFGIARCLSRRCRAERWTLGRDDPCRLNSTGVMCGRCQPGMSLKLARGGCIVCAHTISIYLYTSLVVCMTVIVFSLMVYFNMGLSPLVDSWLFFVQASWYILSASNSFVASTLYSALTFGLGHLCVSQQVTVLSIDGLLLVQPTVLLLLFVALRLASGYRRTGERLQRLQKHMRLIRVLWLVLVYSYFLFAFTAVKVLNSVELSGRRVLSLDGSVEYFGKEHLPYAVVAIAIICVIIVPPPLILLLPQARRSTQLMALIDQACQFYRDDRRWWAAITLLKRVALSLIFALLGGTRLRTVWLVVFFWFLLVAHFIAWPLKDAKFMKISHSTWECFFLFVLQAISVLNGAAQHSDKNDMGLSQAVFVLYVVTATFLPAACLVTQLVSPTGGYGRLRGFNLCMVWRRAVKPRLFGAGDDGDEVLNSTAMAVLVGEDGLRDQLLLDEMRLRR